MRICVEILPGNFLMCYWWEELWCCGGKHCGRFGMILSKNYETYLPINASSFNRSKTILSSPKHLGHGAIKRRGTSHLLISSKQIFAWTKIFWFGPNNFGTWQFGKIGVLVNFIIQKLKSKHLVCLSSLWLHDFLRVREKIFYTYSGS